MLYLCATPIGNIEDVTFRVIRVLKEVDMICAEDTRFTKKLLNHYNIQNKLISYYKYNERKRAYQILQYLKEGKNIALVTNAGVPTLCDPGFEIIKLALKENITITSLPGASAVSCAIVVSGIKPYPFIFFGYIPREKNKRKKFIESIKEIKETIVFFDSPHRILNTLQDIMDIFITRRVAVCRELTKKFEEVIRGDIKEVIDVLRVRDKIKGEITVVMEGKQDANL